MDVNEVYDLLVSSGVKQEDAEKLKGKCYVFVY